VGLIHDSLSLMGPRPVIELPLREVVPVDSENRCAWAIGAALLRGLKLGRRGSDADLVLGLDTSLIAAAKETRVVPDCHSLMRITTCRHMGRTGQLCPYGLGIFALSINAILTPLRTFARGGRDLKIVIQDPRSSNPRSGSADCGSGGLRRRGPRVWERFGDKRVTLTKGAGPKPRPVP